MASLADALAWAARGFRVFPILPLQKEPAVAAFQRVATTDVAIITAWWRDPVTQAEYDYNIGVLTTDMVVVDIDLKDGKPGLESYAALEGHFDTLVVRTPSGGYHCYYDGPDSGLRVNLRPGVDIRSHNGYVIAPGSYVVDATKGIAGEYELYKDNPVVWVPLPIEAELKPPRTRTLRDEAVDYDTPTAIAQATEWLKVAAPTAVEGLGGDNITYQVSAKLVRDYALSVETAFSLLMAHWNERCVPAWDGGELWKKIENAEEYATGSSGSARADAYFNGVEIPIPRAVRKQDGVYFGNALNGTELLPRPWLVERLLMTGYITILGGAGAAGKSITGLIVAAHLASGRSFGKYNVKFATRCVYYDAEDDLAEQSRRLMAICTAYQMDYEQVRANIMLLSSEEFPIILATLAQGQIVANEPHIAALINMVKEPDVGLLVLDPLIELHGCNENDPVHMRFVMGLIRRIAREGHVSVFLTHHTAKPSGTLRDRHGDIDTLRGSTAIPNACRVGLTLFGATAQECERLGIPDHEQHMYVRLDDAKQNLSEKSYYGIWSKWATVQLNSGDKVGVTLPIDVKDKQDEARYSMGMLLREAIVQAGTGAISLQVAVTYLMAEDPLYGKYSTTALRRNVEKLFARPIRIEHDTLQIERVTQNGRDSVLLKLT